MASTKRFRQLSVVGTLGLALAAGLSGCAVDEPAALEHEKSVNISPVEAAEYIPASDEGPAQNVPEPTLDAVASENSPQGAIETVLYFWEAIDYGRLTGDTRHAADVAHYVCDVCSNLIYRWDQIYEDNGWAALHDETQVEVVETHGYHDEHDDRWIVALFSMTEPASDLYQDGELIADESYNAETHDGWWAELRYDETAQAWEIRWLDTGTAPVESAT